MAFSTVLGTFIAVETLQQGQKQLQIIPSSLTIDVAELESITPFWNYLEGVWDTSLTVGHLKSGVTVNINTSYPSMENLLAPGSVPDAPPIPDEPAGEAPSG
jgi:hypothetical protein